MSNPDILVAIASKSSTLYFFKLITSAIHLLHLQMKLDPNLFLCSVIGMPKEKYDPPDPRRMYTIMSSEEAANGKKSYWAELEISGQCHLAFSCFVCDLITVEKRFTTHNSAWY